jgi:hypothetical protein
MKVEQSADTSKITVDILAPKGSSRIDRMAAHIAVREGVSCDDAHLLMLLAELNPTTPGSDIRDFDEGGRASLLWLVHRGFVSLEDHMGILYARVSSLASGAIFSARRALLAEGGSR